LTGAESIQIKSGNGIRDPKVIVSKLPCRELSRGLFANDFGLTKNGPCVNYSVSVTAAWKVRVLKIQEYNYEYNNTSV
jgi:hypothetical protein